ncbi:MAG: FecR domain-containing protein [Halofilum sp. (in: g-proteobacteria)]|nr:FecR domain-containing protein [Halofilum sp. (in: g-proteobacteria)]
MSTRLVASALALLLWVAAGGALAESPSYDHLPDDRVLYVAPGQTLDELVRKAYPDQPDRWAEIRGWIVDHNPHAFVGGDPNRLRGDVRLALPRPSELATSQQAGREGEDYQLVFDERFLFVNPAQSLAELVTRVYADQRGRWDAIVRAIQQRNEQAIESPDAERKIARGTRLQIPNVVDKRAAPPQPVVGRVLEVAGAVTATDAGGDSRALRSGDTVRRGDRLASAPDASAELEFEDGERLTLRPDSRVRVREWSLPETGPGRRVVELLAGGLRAVTGAIGNRGGDDYRTITPTATLGVRGTDYALRLCEPGECRASGGGEVPAGLYLGVADGEVELLNAGGDVRFASGAYGYVADADTAPVMVAAEAAPTVYQAGETAPAAADGDDGPSWWWGLGLLLLLGL